MKIFPSVKIYLDESLIPGAGRGVYAATNIKKGESIEFCPILLLIESQVPNIRQTEIYNYYFMWGKDPKNHKAAIALGFGSLYNHSYSPNAKYIKLRDQNAIEFIALQDIAKNMEITVNYNGDPKSKARLWIESIPPAE